MVTDSQPRLLLLTERNWQGVRGEASTRLHPLLDFSGPRLSAIRPHTRDVPDVLRFEKGSVEPLIRTANRCDQTGPGQGSGADLGGTKDQIPEATPTLSQRRCGIALPKALRTP